MGSDDKEYVEIGVRGYHVTSIRLNTPDYRRFGGKNPYDSCKGATLEDAPRIVAGQYRLMPNPHHICSLIACEKAAGIVCSGYETLRRTLILYGIALREHGLHLADCIRAGMLESGARETEYLCGCAESIAVAGQSLAVALTVGTRPPHMSGLEVARESERLTESREKAVTLARAFASVRRSLRTEPSHPSRIAKASVLWADNGNELACDYRWSCVSSRRIGVEERLDGVLTGLADLVGPVSRLFFAGREKGGLPDSSVDDLAFALNRLPDSDVFLIPMAIAAESVVLIDRTVGIVGSCGDVRGCASQSVPREVALAVIEAPRGTLFHEVRAKDGRIVSGRVVAPTSLNLHMIERSLLAASGELIANRDREAIEERLIMVLRAHYPCMEICDGSLDFRWHDSDD